MATFTELLPVDRASLAAAIAPGQAVPANAEEWDALLDRITLPELSDIVDRGDADAARQMLAITEYGKWLCERGVANRSPGEQRFLQRTTSCIWSKLPPTDRDYYVAQWNAGRATEDEIRIARGFICSEPNGSTLLRDLGVPGGSVCTTADHSAMDLQVFNLANPAAVLMDYELDPIVRTVCARSREQWTAAEAGFMDRLSPATWSCDAVAAREPPPPPSAGPVGVTFKRLSAADAVVIASTLAPGARVPDSQAEWDAVLQTTTFEPLSTLTGEALVRSTVVLDYCGMLCGYADAELSEAERRFLWRTNFCKWSQRPLAVRSAYTQALRTRSLSTDDAHAVRVMACNDPAAKAELLATAPGGPYCRLEDYAPMKVRMLKTLPAADIPERMLSDFWSSVCSNSVDQLNDDERAVFERLRASAPCQPLPAPAVTTPTGPTPTETTPEATDPRPPLAAPVQRRTAVVQQTEPTETHVVPAIIAVVVVAAVAAMVTGIVWWKRRGR